MTVNSTLTSDCKQTEQNFCPIIGSNTNNGLKVSHEHLIDRGDLVFDNIV